MPCLPKPSDTCPNSWREWDKKKKLDPIYFTLLLAFHFLWLAPVCLSTAELLAASNQCVHCSLLPPLLSSFFLSLLPLSLFLPDRSDIRNLYYQVFPGCWWKSWFATPDWIYLSFIPFQPPASCPSRQEPNGLSTRRCQGIKISIYRKRRRERGEGQSVGPHVTALDSSGGSGRGGAMYSLPLPIPTKAPSPLRTFIYLHYTSIYLSANKTCHPESHTHIHRVKLVKSLKGGERSKGHRGNSLNDCNLC